MIYSERYLHTFLSTRIGHGFWNCRLKHTFSYKGPCGKSSILKNDCCVIAQRDVSGLGTICTQRWLAELRVLQRRKIFLGAFAKLQNATISVVMPVCSSVRPSIRPHGTPRLPLHRFSWHFVFEYFSKHVLLTSDRNKGVFTLTPIYEGWNFNSGNYLFTTDTK